MIQNDGVFFAPAGTTHWDRARKTFLDHWPVRLHALSFRSTQIPLTPAEAKAMGSQIPELGEQFYPVEENCIELCDGIVAKLDDAAAGYPDGFFVRLNSRSPKDALQWGVRDSEKLINGRLKTGHDAFRLMTMYSSRICDDLLAHTSMGWPCSIWLREGTNIPAWSEFRCFAHMGKLVGISQYFYREVFPEIARNADAIEKAIVAFYEEKFRPVCPVDTVIFDVYATPSSEGFSIRLIEINPFDPLTDPCMFQWDSLQEFDGSMRFRSETSVPLTA